MFKKICSILNDYLKNVLNYFLDFDTNKDIDQKFLDEYKDL